MIPDIEKLVSDYLRPLVVDELDGRVVGKTPDDHTRPWVRVTKLDGDPRDVADHLVAFMVQLDCYAGADRNVEGRGDHWGGQPEAILLGRFVREALKSVGGGVHDGAVLTGAAVTGDSRVPDSSFAPARERVILTAEVWAHSTPEGS